MNLFNSLIKKTVPYLPKWFSQPFAKPYVAGETVEEALENVSRLNQKGYNATLDILGEHVHSSLFALPIFSFFLFQPTQQSLLERWVIPMSISLSFFDLSKVF